MPSPETSNTNTEFMKQAGSNSSGSQSSYIPMDTYPTAQTMKSKSPRRILNVPSGNGIDDLGWSKIQHLQRFMEESGIVMSGIEIAPAPSPLSNHSQESLPTTHSHHHAAHGYHHHRKRRHRSMSTDTSSSSASHFSSIMVQATQDMNVDDICAQIPRACILSCKTTAIADILEEAELGGMLGLTLALMYESALGHESPWYHYIHSMPSYESIPLFWTQLDRHHLKGTDLDDGSLLSSESKETTLLRDDFETLIQPVIDSHPHIFTPSLLPYLTFEHFIKASSLISSRAFDVDGYHGESLVPLADAFNHKTGQENVHFEWDPDVCPFCGQTGWCECELVSLFETENNTMDGDSHDRASSMGSWETATTNDYENDEDETEDHAMFPEEDDMSLVSSSLARSTLEDQYADEEHIDEDEEEETLSATHHGDERSNSAPSLISEDSGNKDSESDGEDEDKKDLLHMRVVRPCHKGEEVFNTYGIHPNSYLLHRYGFCEQLNPANEISVTREEVLEVLFSSTSPNVNGISRPHNKVQRLKFWDSAGRAMSLLVGEKIEQRKHSDELLPAEEEEPQIDDFLDSQDAFGIRADGTPNFLLATFLYLWSIPKEPWKLLQKSKKSWIQICEAMEQQVDVFQKIQQSQSQETSPTHDHKKRKEGKGKEPLIEGNNSILHYPTLLFIQSTLKEVSKNRLAEYPTTLLHDKDELNRLWKIDLNERSPKIWSLILRIGEKEILHRILNQSVGPMNSQSL